jgi:hypothetical protein
MPYALEVGAELLPVRDGESKLSRCVLRAARGQRRAEGAGKKPRKPEREVRLSVTMRTARAGKGVAVEQNAVGLRQYAASPRGESAAEPFVLVSEEKDYDTSLTP